MRLSPLISHASYADIGGLKRVAERSLCESVPLPEAELAALVTHTHKNIESFIQSSNCVFLAAKMEGVILAYILIKDFWNLSDLFVLPEYQRRGVGKALLQKAIDLARPRSQNAYIRLNASLNAVGFYRKQGFSTTPKHSKTQSVIAMERKF